MPETNKFLSKFNLTRGSKWDGYILHDITATHDMIKIYYEYSYHITCTFEQTNSADYNLFYKNLINTISKKYVIYGIRDPYRCWIDKPKYGDLTHDGAKSITIKLVGHAVKICRGKNYLKN